PLGVEEAHEVVLEGDVELRRARVALAAGAAAELPVDTTRVVPLGADDGKAAGLAYARPELDVGTAAGHVRRDGDAAGVACFGDDLGLALVLLGVEDVVRDAAELQHAAQFLGDVDGGRAHEDGTTGLGQLDDVVDHRIEFLPSGLVHQVLPVIAGDGAIRRNDDHVEFVDLPQFAGFRLGGTRHARELVVHAEVVLQRHRGIGLGDLAHLDVFLRFQRLVQAVGIAAAFHEAARLLVDDLDLALQ